MSVDGEGDAGRWYLTTGSPWKALHEGVILPLMDIELAMSKVRGRKWRSEDAATLRALIKDIQAGCEKAGLFKGMTKEQILAEMRRTREEVWEETKDAVGTRR